MDIALAVSGAEPGAIVLRQTFMSKMWVSRTLARLSELVNSKDYKILVRDYCYAKLRFQVPLEFLASLVARWSCEAMQSCTLAGRFWARSANTKPDRTCSRTFITQTAVVSGRSFIPECCPSLSASENV